MKEERSIGEEVKRGRGGQAEKRNAGKITEEEEEEWATELKEGRKEERRDGRNVEGNEISRR